MGQIPGSHASSDDRDSVILHLKAKSRPHHAHLLTQRLTLQTYNLHILGIEQSGKTAFFLQVLRRLHHIFHLPFESGFAGSGSGSGGASSGSGSDTSSAYVDVVLRTILDEIRGLVDLTYGCQDRDVLFESGSGSGSGRNPRRQRQQQQQQRPFSVSFGSSMSGRGRGRGRGGGGTGTGTGSPGRFPRRSIAFMSEHLSSSVSLDPQILDPDLDIVRDSMYVIERESRKDFLICVSRELRDAIIDLYEVPRIHAFRGFSAVLPYYISCIDRIWRAGVSYRPTMMDILHSYDEFHLEKLEHHMKIFSAFLRISQTKGSRRHRLGWFENLKDMFVVFYLVSLGDFDEVSKEDGSTNRLVESLLMFEQLCGFVQDTVPIFLIFTKFDVFCHKIQLNGLDYAFDEDEIPPDPDLIGTTVVPPMTFHCQVFIDSEDPDKVAPPPRVVARIRRSLITNPARPVDLFHILPEEVIIQILLFFDVIELSRVMTRVCFKLWRMISASDAVWKAIAFLRYPLGESECVQLFRESACATWRQFIIDGAIKAVKRAQFIMNIFEEKMDQVPRHPKSEVFVVNTLDERQIREVVSAVITLFDK